MKMGGVLSGEVEAERRFGFGENWSRFASHLTGPQVDAARSSLARMLGRESLAGLTFLDIGSGSGLFSLAAATMGADRIHSLDFDQHSVDTTARLRAGFEGPIRWDVERGSVLDERYMESLGEWDVVYAWGVLHHSGDMWRAIDNACARVRPGGKLFISIYNDQGRRSRVWARIKRGYNRLPAILRAPYAVAVMLPLELRAFVSSLLRGRPGEYVREWGRAARERRDRGMSRWHDLVDWVGGYPFEVASPDAVSEFCADRGFERRRLVDVEGGYGCNEFVFERTVRASGGSS